ncbi:Acyl carrier protein [Mariniphaga anaerophila]|uniref:Acyl carrier protein n=1 Tax=Mariniphaga anaerophila TaxID=1484053 RepID=A0A1M5BJV5_9BACT|nr:acyl carrier protein [Mariniphaga anaerophila]SHF42821.1 Acyl carrier protein [Mariniphaga anaerophila]
MDTIITQTEQLRSFISEITFKEIDEITEDTLLFEEGVFDSLGFLSLISFISENFGIEVENDELNEENFQSIKSVISFISKKKNVLE